jgi:hypothetical protein
MNTRTLKQTAGILPLPGLWTALAILCVNGCLIQSGLAQDYGINLPPAYYVNGVADSGDAAFQPVVYDWPYTDAQVAGAAADFNMIRFPINEPTANNPASLTQLEGYINQIPGHWAIICMCGTNYPGAPTSHGNGFPDGLAAMGAAWKKINAVFSSYPNVYYEIFNEPFGYDHTNAAHYVSDMETIISDGGLPTSKCILDGQGYADDIIDVANAGWNGMLGYHFYPTWISGSAN